MKIDSDFIKQIFNLKFQVKNKEENQMYPINKQNIHYRLIESYYTASYSSKCIFLFSLLIGILFRIAFFVLFVWYGRELSHIIATTNLTCNPLIRILAEDDSLIASYCKNGEITCEIIDVIHLPNHLINAVLAIEDRRFYNHYGIDPIGIARAMFINITSGRMVQGGSTITQQLAKNLFLTPERNLKRKIQEAMLALWLEHMFTKDEILTAYLNRVYLGCGAYGVDAAARVYYDKSARDLTLCEATMIAGLLKSPTLYSPATNIGLSNKRANIVLQTMVDSCFLTEDEKLKIKTRVQPSCRPASGKYSRYFAAILLTGLWFRIKTIAM